MQLPDIIKYPAVQLIGEKCYTSLVEEFNVTDVDCIKLLISKGLGIGIVLGGALVKLPQIIKITSARSSRGLSFEGFVLETAAMGISFAYNLRQGNPFSTFGESAFLTVQNIIILLLILYYANRTKDLITTTAVVVISAYTLTQAWLISDANLAYLQTLTIPISLLSKIPQILTNYRNGNTGQLSALAVFGFALGSLARIFTTLTEVDDLIILSGFVFTSILNLILVAQMIMYWNVDSKINEKME
ncbi:11060_t:CDS:1 [Acaulospora morrowiae]|uniref:Mannose-P-dolichol utilization defect 1 protein homolog n=1 Tax=Acaulospora morrowiae TaxID=94023 RepID=A0A9N9HWC3_9GLOM|nr:11060_t:CDS:1 [Acaulospora morrowiae]